MIIRSPQVRTWLRWCVLTGLLAGVALLPNHARAQATINSNAVRYIPDLRLWVLRTERTSYVMGINERDELQTLYWGEKLTNDRDLAAARSHPAHASFDSSETMTNLEYPGWGGLYYNEPALKVTPASGVRDRY